MQGRRAAVSEDGTDIWRGVQPGRGINELSVPSVTSQRTDFQVFWRGNMNYGVRTRKIYELLPFFCHLTDLID